MEPRKLFFISKSISDKRELRLTENAFATSIISVFLSKVFPSALRNVIVRVTSGMLRLSNQ